MKKYLFYTIVAIGLGWGFYQQVYIPKHTFETMRASSGDMAVVVNGVGSVGAKDIYRIGSLYGGKVASFDINEGDFIKKGELIAQIDSVDLGDKISEQEASIKKLENDTHSLMLEQQSAKLQYDYQEDIFEKNKHLFKNKTISEQDFNKYTINRDVAKLTVDAIGFKIASLKSLIEQTRATIDGLKQRLKRYTIIAPVEGYIVKKLISNHQIINPNQTLIEIVNPKDVWVETHIDTRISGEVKIGNPATIKLRSSSQIYQGIVTNIKPINNEVTNEREIDVSFKQLPLPFYLAEQAIVDIQKSQLTNITRIPLKALDIERERSGVWVAREGRVTFKPIEILAHGDEFVATKEIVSGEILAIANPKKKSLTDGMKIYHD